MKTSNHKWIIIFSGIAIIAFSYFSMQYLSGFNKKPQPVPKQEIIRKVKTKKINYSTISTTFQSNGRVNSTAEIVLSAEVSGKILNGDISFKTGESFKKNDLLIKIFDKEAEFGLMAKKSGFLNKVAGLLADYKTDFPDKLGIWSEFFDKIDINKNLPDLPKITSSKEKVFLASRNILTEYYSIKADEIRISKHNIYAPFDGAITEVFAEVGAIANPGVKLAKIIDINNLEIEVPLELDIAQWISINSGVKVINKSGEYFSGKVIRKAGDVNQQTQSIAVYVKITNTKAKEFVKGQYVDVLFDEIPFKNVMELNRSAVFNSDEVFIIEKSTLRKRKINLVKVLENTLLFNGLPIGTEIVNEALINANENTKVMGIL